MKYLKNNWILLLPIVAAIGAQLGTIITPVAVIFAAIVITFLVTRNKIESKRYPYYLFVITLSLMYSASMVGAHVVGSDMHQEFYISNVVQSDGWNYIANYGSQSSTSFVVGWLVPLLSNLFHVDIIWIYKLVLPFIFSFVPVILYYAFRKQTSDKIAYLACFFFMAVPVATLEIVQIGKSMVAEVFLALIILTLVSEIKHKLWIILGCLIIALWAHYTVGLMALAYLFCILTVRCLPLKRWSLFRNPRVSIIVLIAVLVIGSGLGYAYYSKADGGSIASVVGRIVPGYSKIIDSTFSDMTNTRNEGDIDYNNLPYSGIAGLIQEQAPLVQIALGADFMDASFLGKIFRILQWSTQLMIIVGAVYLIFRPKKYDFTPEFITGIGASFILLLMCMFVPHFSGIINMTRFYQISLFFLSPLIIIGGQVLFKRESVTVGIIVAYFLFTSGLVFESVKSNRIDRPEIPYSIGLSAERTGVVASYTKDDVNAAEWIKENHGDHKIVGDYNGYRLMMGFVYLGYLKPDIYNPIYGYNYDFENPPEDCFIIVTSWDTKHNLYITDIRGVWEAVGLRQAVSLPELNYTLVYQSGNTKVFKT